MILDKGALTYMFMLDSSHTSFVEIVFTRILTCARVHVLRVSSLNVTRKSIICMQCKWRGKIIRKKIFRYYIYRDDIINTWYNVTSRRGFRRMLVSFPVSSGTTMRMMRTRNACNMTVIRAGRPTEMAFCQF